MLSDSSMIPEQFKSLLWFATYDVECVAQVTIDNNQAIIENKKAVNEAKPIYGESAILAEECKNTPSESSEEYYSIPVISD